MSTQYAQFKRIGYGVVSGVVALESSDASQQLRIHSVGVYNAEATDKDVAIGLMLNTDSAKVYTNTTTPVSNSDSRNPVVTGGMVLVTSKPIDFMTWTSITGTPEVLFWNGSAFVAITEHTKTADIMLWSNPQTQVVGSSYSTLDQSKYHYQFTGPSAIEGLKLCRTLKFQKDLGSAQFLELNFPEEKGKLMCETGEAIVPYFETANADNVVEIWYQQQK